MTRVFPRLLLVLGALLLAVWVVVPVATSPPRPQSAAAALVAPAVVPAPELEEINREVDRLREWLASPPLETEAVRDPFQFAEPAYTRVEAPAASVDSVPMFEPEAPAVAWPALVAILASGSATDPVLRAVFEDASELVQIRTAGGTLGDIVVTSVSDDAATLTHVPSGESTRVPLR